MHRPAQPGQLEKRRSALAVATLFVLLLGLCLLLLRRYLVGPYQYVFLDSSSDTLRINLPTYYMVFDLLRDGFSGWSMRMGIGTSILTHADVLFDPFTYLSFIGGRAHIADFMIVSVIAKIIASGLACYGFLRCFALRRTACMIASIGYAFSGYMLVMGRNYVFATICVYLPLVLWGTERFLRHAKWGLLLGSLFLTVVYFYYFFYMTAIFVGIYAATRFCMLFGFSARPFFQMLLRLILIGITALLLSSFLVLPTVLLTLQSARLAHTGLSESSLVLPNVQAFITGLARLFGADAAGVFEIWNYAGYSHNYFELATFTSALAVLALPQYFSVVDRKQRRRGLLFIGLAAVCVLMPAVSYVLNGFSALTYRWSYVLCLLLTLCCALSLHTVFERGRTQRKLLFGSLMACWLILLASQSALLLLSGGLDSFFVRFSKTYLAHPTTLVPYFILAAYCIVLLLPAGKPGGRCLMAACLIAVMGIEMFANYYHWLHSAIAVTRDESRPESTYFDDSFAQIQALQSEDSSFYRIAKIYDSVRDVEGGLISDNDAMIQGFYGLQSYNSQNQPNYIDFLQRMGIFVMLPLRAPLAGETPQELTGTSLNFINGVGTRYAIASYLGTKYYLVKNPVQPVISPENLFYYYNAASEPAFIAPDYFTLLSEENQIRCYRNDACFPFAFSRNKYVSETAFSTLSDVQKDLVLSQYGVVSDKLASENALPLTDIAQACTQAAKTTLAARAQQHRERMHSLLLRSDADISLTLTVPENESIITFTTPYEDGWRITLNGAQAPALRTDCGMLGVAAASGTYEVHLRYLPRGLWVGIVLSLCTLLSLCAFCIFRRYKKRAKLSI